GFRLCLQALLPESNAEVLMSTGEVRLEANGLLQRIHGRIQGTLPREMIAKVGISESKVRRQAKGDPILGDGFVQGPLIGEVDTQIHVRAGAVRPEHDGHAEIPDRVVQLRRPQMPKPEGQIVVDPEVAGMLTMRRSEQLQSFLDLTGFDESVCQANDR